MKKEKVPVYSLRLRISDEQMDYWLSTDFREYELQK